MKALGVLLIVLGIVGLVWGGLAWTRHETVADLGPVEINRETRESIPLPPIAGAVLLVAGVGVLLASKR